MPGFAPRRLGEIVLALVAAALLAAGATWWLAPPGTVAQGLSAPSPTLDRPIRYSLYAPARPPAKGRRLPVLYLLHGLGGDEGDWLRSGGLARRLDRLIGSGRLKPLYVVMPDAGESWYVDNPDPGGGGAMVAALGTDLVRHVEATLPVLSCRGGRALAGQSAGGYGALLQAMDHPDRFAAAISLSGFVFEPMDAARGRRAGRARGMFNGAFGDPFDWKRFNRWNLFPRIPMLARSSAPPDIYLAVASRDYGTVRRGNARLRDALRTAGLAPAWRMDRGDHDWSLWSRQIEPALAWLDSRLAATCEVGDMEGGGR